MSFRAQRAGPSVTSPWGECLVAWACTALMGGAWFLPQGGWGQYCFSFHGNKSQLQLGPLLHTTSTTHTSSSSFQPAPRVPDACLAQGYQAAGGSSLPSPGCQVLAPLFKGLESGRRKERLFGFLLGLVRCPVASVPRGNGRPLPLSGPASQPASSAPGQMHRLRTDVTCDLESYAQSRADKGGALRERYPTWASVSGSRAVAKPRSHTEWLGRTGLSTGSPAKSGSKLCFL